MTTPTPPTETVSPQDRPPEKLLAARRALTIVGQPASFWRRALALCLDLVLALGLSFAILRLQLPLTHPEGLAAFSAILETASADSQAGQAALEAALQTDGPLVRMLTFAQGLTFFVAWLTLWLASLSGRSATLGQKIVGIWVSDDTGAVPCTPLRQAVRCSLKLFCFFAHPILWLGFFIPFINRRRKSLVDYACRTVVLTEKERPVEVSRVKEPGR